jgi:hypothetical protein
MLMADVNTTTIGRVFSAKGSAEERAEMVQSSAIVGELNHSLEAARMCGAVYARSTSASQQLNCNEP